MNSIIKTFLFTLFTGYSIQAVCQTASVDRGCAPLKVEFTSPNLSDYYWDFGDGTESIKQFPDHEFVNPGKYTVTLYEGLNGNKIGTIDITIYPDPIISIDSDITGGCNPLTVSFTSAIDKDPDINITSWLWTFGDGASATSKDVVYTYGQVGTYTVSLKITTDVTECEETLILNDYIKVDGPNVLFAMGDRTACEVPAEFTLLNLSPEDGSTYLWVFGNGTTSTEFNPGSVIYDEFGQYVITLQMTTSNGCINTYDQTVNVGPPIFNISVPDTSCAMFNTLFMNTSLAQSFYWTFESGSIFIDSNEPSPSINFSVDGIYEVNLVATGVGGCMSDTSFNILINAAAFSEFTVDPIESCKDDFSVSAEAINKGMAKYTWNDSIEAGPNIFLPPDILSRDSFHINVPYVRKVILEAETEFGCVSRSTKEIEVRKPEAYFIPDKVIGFSPLEVVFEDLSLSNDPIIYSHWDMGDGEEFTYSTPTDVTHTYTDIGLYFVKLDIENTEECQDTSKGVFIEVIDTTRIFATCNGNGGPLNELIICAGTEVEITLGGIPDRWDTHLETDDGRLSHCWKDRHFYHTFETPGVYPIIISFEYKGVYIYEEDLGFITVIGVKPDAEYKVDCSDPYTVNLFHQSTNGSQVRWLLDGVELSREDQFSHTFPETGVYFIDLEVDDPNDQCPPVEDRLEIHITDVKAGFSLKDSICALTNILIDASSSVDVNPMCHQGYLWEFSNGSRPRELGTTDLNHIFPVGENQMLTLTVTDINGCTDSVSQNFSAYGIDAKFEVPNRMCLPFEFEMTDQSIANLPITNWQWEINEESISTNQNDRYICDYDTYNTFSALGVTLSIEDELGCKDSESHFIELYQPTSEIFTNDRLEMCAGESISFTASDYTVDGSFLNFNWDIGAYGNQTGSTANIQADIAGMHDVILSFTEDATGCFGEVDTSFLVLNYPEANFITSGDTLESICHTDIIQFENTSVIDGYTTYQWDFGNGAFSSLENPAISYDKGIFEIELIVTSYLGCSDRISKSIELVGPLGSFLADKTTVCLGEEITFSLIDTSDIQSWTWDFGDGTVISNVNPVSHEYGENVPSNQTEVSLILKSAETDCELITTFPIQIVESGLALFDTLQTIGFCNGKVEFVNLSENADRFNWDFGNGMTSSEENPTVEFGLEADSLHVSLEISNSQTECRHKSTKVFPPLSIIDGEFLRMPNVFSPNGDDRNDYFTYFLLDESLKDKIDINDFKIYNRWGNLIYNNDQPDIGWDGNWKGKNAPVEVYSYYIEIGVEECNPWVKKGNVTIVR